MATRVLSVHAGYGCRRRGACCSAGWPIRVDANEAQELGRALDRQALTLRIGTEAFAVPGRKTPDTPAHLARPDGRCVFFDDESETTCRVQATLGHGALPLACRQFPRVTVRDPRGASITLSHYCPTAAEMLHNDRTPTILTNAERFPKTGEYIGLDARSGVPPLLRPDMAMDWVSWWEWERLSVEALVGDAAPIDETLARLRGAIETLRRWTPPDGPLIDHVRRVFSGSSPVAEAWSTAVLVEDVGRAIPDDLRPPGPPAGRDGRPHLRVHRNFLAAHAFANWTAHLGLGLRAWLRSIEGAHALLAEGHTVGEADLWLRHLADPDALAAIWSRTETTSRP